MSDVHTYRIDGEHVGVRIDDAAAATFGEPVLLSTRDSDITFGQPWYDRGFAVVDLLTDAEFAALHQGIAATVRSLLADVGRDTTGFTLECYHRFADDATHAQVTGRTRDLSPDDLCFDVPAMHARLSEVLDRPLTDTLAGHDDRLHVIVRLNRPGSADFNPVHKDVYEAVDRLGIVPRFVNFWLPIAGVGPRSSLPVAPGSHLLRESEVLRTRAGSTVDGRRYRVNSVLEWGGERSLERVPIVAGQVLVFSAHLVHGLAVNAQPDTTRIALEFRLAPA